MYNRKEQNHVRRTAAGVYPQQNPGLSWWSSIPNTHHGVAPGTRVRKSVELTKSRYPGQHQLSYYGRRVIRGISRTTAFRFEPALAETARQN